MPVNQVDSAIEELLNCVNNPEKMSAVCKYVHIEVQVAFVGINSLYGGTSALLLKQSPFIKCLKLYDGKNIDAALDISLINTQCKVKTYLGDGRLEEAFEGSDIIIVNDETHHFYDLDSHLKSVCGNFMKYARAISNASPQAIVVVTSTPVNCLLPMMSQLLARAGCYNHNKVVGSTSIDTIRASALLATRLNLDPKDVVLPVIGGSSELTRVPIFSQARPLFSLNNEARESLIADIRRGGNLVLANKGSPESMNRAHSTVRFVNSILAGLRGDQAATDIALTRTNLVPGVEYFSLPVTFGRDGVVNRFGLPNTTPAEDEMIDSALKHVKKDADRASFVVKETVDAPQMKFLSSNDRASSQKDIFDLYVKSLERPDDAKDNYSFQTLVSDELPTSSIISENKLPPLVQRRPTTNGPESHFFRAAGSPFQTPIFTLEPLNCPSAPLTNFDEHLDDDLAEFKEELLHDRQMAKLEKFKKVKPSLKSMVDPIANFKKQISDVAHKPPPKMDVDDKTTLFDNIEGKLLKKPYRPPQKNLPAKVSQYDELKTKQKTASPQNDSKLDDKEEKYKTLLSALFNKLNGLGEGFYLPVRNHYEGRYKSCNKSFTENVIRSRAHSTSAVIPTRAPYKIRQLDSDVHNSLKVVPSYKKNEYLVRSKIVQNDEVLKEEGEVEVKTESVDDVSDTKVASSESVVDRKIEMRDEPKPKLKKPNIAKSALENEVYSERLKRLKDKINEKLIPLLKSDGVEKPKKPLSRPPKGSPLVIGKPPSDKPVKHEWKGVPFVVRNAEDDTPKDDRLSGFAELGKVIRQSKKAPAEGSKVDAGEIFELGEPKNRGKVDNKAEIRPKIDNKAETQPKVDDRAEIRPKADEISRLAVNATKSSKAHDEEEVESKLPTKLQKKSQKEPNLKEDDVKPVSVDTLTKSEPNIDPSPTQVDSSPTQGGTVQHSTASEPSKVATGTTKVATKLQFLSTGQRPPRSVVKVKKSTFGDKPTKTSAAVKIAQKYKKPCKTANYKHEKCRVKVNILDGFDFPRLKVKRRIPSNSLLKELSNSVVPTPVERPANRFVPKIKPHKKALSEDVRCTTVEYNNDERAAYLTLKTILRRNSSPPLKTDVGKGSFDAFRDKIKSSARRRKPSISAVERKLKSTKRDKKQRVVEELLSMPQVRHQPEYDDEAIRTVDEIVGTGVSSRAKGSVVDNWMLPEYEANFVLPSLKDTHETFHLEERPTRAAE